MTTEDIQTYYTHEMNVRGVRRSEAVGLKWSAIDLTNRTITIKHTVTSGTLDGKFIESDRTKNKASRRTLPLVDTFYELLIRMKELQEANRLSYGNAYCTDYLEYIYVDALGELLNPVTLRSIFQFCWRGTVLEYRVSRSSS
ncbi:hypothetical protein ABU162_08520 [Paenibacillus thiaminolyticus]|uniref:hypothetical protein n=1 Tax=Paenibacillus thiaminolyticus TaxID=49283 RepID=UPI0035A68D95